MILKMSVFTLAISCLTTSNLPRFMVLTFQVPMQYCSLQHQILLSPPDTFTTGCHFDFGSAFSFLLELFLCSSPVAYWARTDLGSSSFTVISFGLFYSSWGSQGKNAEAVCHTFSSWPCFVRNVLPDLRLWILWYYQTTSPLHGKIYKVFIYWKLVPKQNIKGE